MVFGKIRNCFDSAPVNVGRQRELDVAKGIVILFMALSHSIEVLCWFFDPQTSGGFFWEGFDMVIKGTAPVFIFCMGLSFCYSKKQSARDMLHRALHMAVIAALLEFARGVLPFILEWLIFRDPESMVYAKMIITMDILWFASLALLVFALMKALKLSVGAMLAVSAVCSVIAQLLCGVSVGSWLGDRLVGMLWRSYEESYFPLMNWLIVLVLGYAIGKLWLRLRDKDTFFAWVTPIGIAIAAAYYASMLLIGKWYYLSGGTFYGIGILDVAFLVVIFFATVGVSYFLQKWLPWVSRWLGSMGERLNSFYCIHWTIYDFLYVAVLCIVGDGYVPKWVVLPVAVAVLVAADLISRLYKHMTRARKTAVKGSA